MIGRPGRGRRRSGNGDGNGNSCSRRGNTSTAMEGKIRRSVIIKQGEFVKELLDAQAVLVCDLARSVACTFMRQRDVAGS